MNWVEAKVTCSDSERITASLHSSSDDFDVVLDILRSTEWHYTIEISWQSGLEREVSAKVVDTVHGDFKQTMSLLDPLWTWADDVTWLWCILFKVLGAKWQSLHPSLRYHGLLVDSLADYKSASEVGMLGKHIVIVPIPEEVGLHNDGNLEVSWHTVAVDRDKLRVIDVVDLDFVLREAVSVDTDFDSEWVVSNVVRVVVSHGILRLTQSFDVVLVYEGGRVDAWCSACACEVTLFLGGELGLNSFLSVDETESLNVQFSATLSWNELRDDIKYVRIKESVGNMVISEIIAIHRDINVHDIGLRVVWNGNLDLRAA